MKEDSLNILRSSDVITDKLDQIIDAFTEYYGEERRKEITDKFNSILILKFTNTNSLRMNISKIKTRLFKEVFGVESNEYLFFEFDSFWNFLYENKQDIKQTDIPYISDEIKEIITGDKSISSYNLIMNYKAGMYPKLEEFMIRYRPIMDILHPYEEQVRREEDREEKIKDSYFKTLVDEFSFLFPQSELDSFNQTGIASSTIMDYLGLEVNDFGHCFDDESQRLLDDPETKEWRKESIIFDRLRFLENFFKIEGKDNGRLNPPTYEDYLNNPLSKEFIDRTRIFCERITKRKKELYRKQTIEIVEGLEDYKKLRSEIDKRGLIDKDDPLGPFVYTSSVSCFSPNYTKSGNGFAFSPIILINSGSTELDCTIIHELNHALEHTTLSINENGSYTITGWDDGEYKFLDHQELQELTYNGISRGHELLSEYVNDRLAQEITDVMHKNGNFIISPNRSNNTSSYLVISIFAEEFFKEFKDVIIKSRSNNNIEYLFECVGRENFESLNALVNEFNQEFGIGLGAQSAIVDYYNKENNENYFKISNLVERKNQILASMREHLTYSQVSL